MTRDDISHMLSAELATGMDGFLATDGFFRDDGALQFSRDDGDCTQLIDMQFDLNPTYQPRALAHVLPRVSVILPDVNLVAIEMVGDAPNLLGSVRATFSQQIQNAAPRDARHAAVSWFISHEEDARLCISSMASFIRRWTVPFLNEYTTVNALVAGHERRDERLPHDRRFSLVVVAAYLVLNEPTKAARVLEVDLGRPGARRQYANVFAHVRRRLGELS
jgi:hypothetical protein